MPSGFAHAGICHGSKVEALQSFASSAFPRVIDASGCTYVQHANLSGEQLVVATVPPAGSQCPAVDVAFYAPNFVACDALAWTPAGPWLSVTDAAIVSGAIVGLWCIAWACKAAVRALRDVDASSEA